VAPVNSEMVPVMVKNSGNAHGRLSGSFRNRRIRQATRVHARNTADPSRRDAISLVLYRERDEPLTITYPSPFAATSRATRRTVRASFAR
jgi:hypothetical protein